MPFALDAVDGWRGVKNVLPVRNLYALALRAGKPPRLCWLALRVGYLAVGAVLDEALCGRGLLAGLPGHGRDIQHGRLRGWRWLHRRGRGRRFLFAALAHVQPSKSRESISLYSFSAWDRFLPATAA